ncbi:MAG: hypothetical protein IJA10_05470 [Lachnospiraceae bacterium]|nr:hypothetical protein [Lachnospiraceae bacterium]
MGNVIICQTQEGKKPYIFENARIEVYSYEELCYYIYYNIPMLDENTITEKLLQWISEELNLSELSEKIRCRMESQNEVSLYQTILGYRSYFTKQEIEVFLVSFEEYQLLTPFEKQKKKADSLLLYKRYMKAFHIYETIAMQMGEKENMDQEEKIFLGNIYHNMAVCQGKNLEWEQAKQNFRKAYALNKNTESLKEYFFILKLSAKEEEMQEEEKKFCLSEEFFLDIQDEIEDSEKEIKGMEVYKKFEYAIYNKEHGKYFDYSRRIDAMLEQWKMELKEQWI